VPSGVVTQLRINLVFTMVIDAWWEIRIETVFSYGTADK
jgi:hypothetical protein